MQPTSSISPSTEAERVAGHLWLAECRVRSRASAPLSPARRLVRTLLLQELADYRRARRFPRNPSFAERTPFFVDAAGTPCAVAHLLQASGEQALVRRISGERNNARVHELANEPRLAAWLSAAGLTLEDAAAIQPTYQRYAGECVCGEYGSGETLAGTTPADGVLVGTAITDHHDDAHSWTMRITQIYGQVRAYAVGQEIIVTAANASQTSDPTPIKEQTQLLIPIHLDAPMAGDGGALPLEAIVLSDDGSFTCDTRRAQVDPLSQGELAGVLQSDDCDAALKAIDPAWSQRWTEGGLRPAANGCSLSPDGATDSALTIAILLALTAVRAARASRR